MDLQRILIWRKGEISIKIYNTLTRRKEEFVPIEKNKVRIYVCGPTVYNRIHFGNARPIVVFDAFRRFLTAKGYEVTFVTNFTDVDDKIITRANEEGISTEEVSKRSIEAVLEDADGLGCLRADIYPKVTEEMDGIIAMIDEILKNGYAYKIEGTVYFDTEAKEDYGKLSGRDIDDQEAGARVEVDGRKKRAGDFVLWKPAKAGEPFWKSPWGLGRPGWHIECSWMIRKYLGITADIHAGGTDLVFPHHENEIAQSEAANGAALAKYWMHNGMVNTDLEKMSKSDGNFFMVNDLARAYGYKPLRLYLLSFHYRSPINFAPEHVESAKSSWARILNCVAALKDAEHQASSQAEIYKQRFYEALEDDFNTADAIGALFELVKYANVHPDKRALEVLLEMCEVLGLDLEREQNQWGMAEADIEEILARRKLARENRDWTLSDQLRDQLLAAGIVIKDGPEGTKWHYEAK